MSRIPRAGSSLLSPNTKALIDSLDTLSDRMSSVSVRTPSVSSDDGPQQQRSKPVTGEVLPYAEPGLNLQSLVQMLSTFASLANRMGTNPGAGGSGSLVTLSQNMMAGGGALIPRQPTLPTTYEQTGAIAKQQSYEAFIKADDQDCCEELVELLKGIWEQTGNINLKLNGPFGGGGSNQPSNKPDKDKSPESEFSKFGKGVNIGYDAVSSGIWEYYNRSARSDRYGDMSQAAQYAANAAAKLVANALPEPLKGPAVAATKVTGDLLDKLEMFRQLWKDMTQNNNFAYSGFSPGMTVAQMEHQVRQMQIDKEKGDARAESAREKAEAEDELNRILAKKENDLVIQANKEATEKIREEIRKQGGAVPEPVDPNNRPIDMNEWMWQLGRGDHWAVMNRPRRLAPNPIPQAPAKR